MKKHIFNRPVALVMAAVFSLMSVAEPFAGTYDVFAAEADADLPEGETGEVRYAAGDAVTRQADGNAQPEGFAADCVMTTEADWEYTIDDSDNIVLEKYKGSATQIIIPGTMTVEQTSHNVIFQSMGAGAEGSTATNVVSIVVGEGVTAYPQSVYSEDGPECFFGSCSNLENLDISNLDTSAMTMMNYMFHDCSKLKSINLIHNDTENVGRMIGLFKNCSSLEEVILHDEKSDENLFDAYHVDNMSSMFEGCSSLKSIDMSALYSPRVTSMVRTFAGCSSLTELDMSQLDTSSVIDFTGLFENCTGLKEINTDNSRITNSAVGMERMFYGCSSLTYLDVYNFNVKTVRSMKEMFAGCSSLTRLDISSWEALSLEDVSGMFAGCSSLTKILGSDLDLFMVYNLNEDQGRDMFLGCTKLVGGQGTVYSSEHTGVSYAHRDLAQNSLPGYFSTYYKTTLSDWDCTLVPADDNWNFEKVLIKNYKGTATDIRIPVYLDYTDGDGVLHENCRVGFGGMMEGKTASNTAE
ncbi:MAG: BspA family leucine-rich repeat surface protein, partial [Lachnospiraceae bacterium]|nr:BspA family leucine-rich repeat surface protein [Lachnospiraceae bacterium]